MTKMLRITILQIFGIEIEMHLLLYPPQTIKRLKNFQDDGLAIYSQHTNAIQE